MGNPGMGLDCSEMGWTARGWDRTARGCLGMGWDGLDLGRVDHLGMNVAGPTVDRRPWLKAGERVRGPYTV